MGISVIYEDNSVYSVELDGKVYFSENEDSITIEKSAFQNQSIYDLPCGLIVELCDHCDERNIFVGNVPASIARIKGNLFKVTFNESVSRKYWDLPIGMKLWFETKRDILIERSEKIDDVSLESYEDDGVWVHIVYSSCVEVEKFEDLFIYVDTLYNELEGATDISLGSPFEKIENCQKENDFTVKVLLPLFRNMGFSNVKYNHGNKEYGKDVTFARRTEFDEYEFYGVQVKFGDVSGGASGEINTLIAQAKDAFSMPFYDVYSRKQVRISKVVIAISGRFTSNAIEKIVEGITDYPMKNNLVFLDEDKIRTFMERYRRF